jgi:nucleotide-binding universal stress UspA family protein
VARSPGRSTPDVTAAAPAGSAAQAVLRSSPIPVMLVPMALD